MIDGCDAGNSPFLLRRQKPGPHKLLISQLFPSKRNNLQWKATGPTWIPPLR